VKPTKLVKGQGLAKLLVESKFREIEINNLESHESLLDIEKIGYQAPTIRIQDKFFSSNSYHDIVTYLLTLQLPNDMTMSKERNLKLHAIKYCIINGRLYWKDPLGFLLCFLTECEIEGIINEFYEGVYGGQHGWREMAYKILRVGYYFPNLFTDVNVRFRSCNSCQLFFGK
jgi:hypothetical protein